MSRFEEPHIATAEDVAKGRGRCYLCGHAPVVGAPWRYLYAGDRGFINCTICAQCDGPDVLDRWAAANEEAKRRFWWLLKEIEDASKSAALTEAAAYEGGYREGHRDGARGVEGER